MNNQEAGINRWVTLIPFIIGLGVALPVYEQIHESITPHLGSLGAFGVGIIASVVVSFPVYLLAIWIIHREPSVTQTDVPAKIYRPALLPAWATIVALLKDFPNAFSEFMVWPLLAWLIALFTGVFLIQRRQRCVWSWKIAILIGTATALIALPVSALTTWLIAPHALKP